MINQSKSRKQASTGAKINPRIYIDPSDFYLMRRRAFLTTQQAAVLLDVTHRTVLNWEKGRARIPYTAYRVLKMEVGYVFNDKHFKDWFVKGDTFWSPEGRGFKPFELRYIGNYFWMARQWLAERQTLKTLFNATIASGEASDGSPTSPAPQALHGEVGTLPSDGAALPHPKPVKLAPVLSQQEKPKDFEKFLESLGIVA